MYRLWSQNSAENLPAVRGTDVRPTEIILPQTLQPVLQPLPEGSHKNTQFYVLEDKTGVLVIGSFDGYKEENTKCYLLQGLQKMRELGVDKLIIDVVSVFGHVTAIYLIHVIDQ